MAWSTPRVWSVGELLTAANFNTYISDNLSYLYSAISAQFWLSGRSGLASITNGAGLGAQFEMTTNKQNFYLPSFVTGAQRYLEWEHAFPGDYNGGTVTAAVFWLANSASGNSVVWGLQGRSYADTETIDQAWGTAQEVTDANQTTAYKLNKSALTGAITLAGTPAAGELAKWRGYRLGSGSDNLAVAAFLVGMQVNYTRS